MDIAERSRRREESLVDSISPRYRPAAMNVSKKKSERESERMAFLFIVGVRPVELDEGTSYEEYEAHPDAVQ